MNPNKAQNKYIPPKPTRPRYPETTVPTVNIDETLTDQVFSMVSSGNLAELEKFFLSNTVPLTITNSNGETVLHSALTADFKEGDMLKLVTMLVDKGAPINKKNKFELTPLHLAVKKMYPSVVEFLVSRGAHPDSTNTELLTPIHLACMSYFKECYPEKQVEDLIPPPKISDRDVNTITTSIIKMVINKYNTDLAVKAEFDQFGSILTGYKLFVENSMVDPKDPKAPKPFSNIQNGVTQALKNGESDVTSFINDAVKELSNQMNNHFDKSIDIGSINGTIGQMTTEYELIKNEEINKYKSSVRELNALISNLNINSDAFVELIKRFSDFVSNSNNLLHILNNNPDTNNLVRIPDNYLFKCEREKTLLLEGGSGSNKTDIQLYTAIIKACFKILERSKDLSFNDVDYELSHQIDCYYKQKIDRNNLLELLNSPDIYDTLRTKNRRKTQPPPVRPIAPVAPAPATPLTAPTAPLRHTANEFKPNAAPAPATPITAPTAPTAPTTPITAPTAPTTPQSDIDDDEFFEDGAKFFGDSEIDDDYDDDLEMFLRNQNKTAPQAASKAPMSWADQVEQEVAEGRFIFGTGQQSGGATVNMFSNLWNFVRYINNNNIRVARPFVVPDDNKVDTYKRLVEISTYINTVQNRMIYFHEKIIKCLEYKQLLDKLNDIKNLRLPRAIKIIISTLSYYHRDLMVLWNRTHASLIENIGKYRDQCVDLIRTINNIHSLEHFSVGIQIKFVGILPSFTLPNLRDNVKMTKKDYVLYTIPNINNIGRDVPVQLQVPGWAQPTVNGNLLFDFRHIVQRDINALNLVGRIGLFNGDEARKSIKLYNPKTLNMLKRQVLVGVLNKFTDAEKDTIKDLIKKSSNSTLANDQVLNELTKTNILETINSLLDQQLKFFCDIESRKIVNDIVSAIPGVRLPTDEALFTGPNPLNADRYINFSELNSKLYKDLIAQSYPAFVGIRHELPIMRPAKVSIIERNQKDASYNIFYDTNYFQEYMDKVYCYNNNSITVLKALKTPSISYNIQDIKGRTPLFYAVEGYNLDIIRELLNIPNKLRLTESKDKSGVVASDIIISKEKYHFTHLLDKGDGIAFSKKYWEMLKTELEEHNFIKNNIPFYLENIFDIALYIQNYYWKNAVHRVTIPGIIKSGDIETIVANLGKEIEQYRRAKDSIFALKDRTSDKDQYMNLTRKWGSTTFTSADVGNNRFMYLPGEHNNIINDVNNVNLPVMPPPVMPPLSDELYFQDIIIMQLRKVAELFNEKHHTGYSIFWANILPQKRDLLHIDLSIQEKAYLDDKPSLKAQLPTVKATLKDIITFIEFQYMKDKSLEGNIYYGYLVRLYTHILGQILGSNMYNAIKRLVFNEVLSQVSKAGDRDAANMSANINIILQQVKAFVLNDKLNGENMNFLYVLKALNRDELSKFEEINKMKSEDELFDMLTKKLEKLPPSLNVLEPFKDNLLPYYKTLYSSVFKHMNNMMRNYHKFILNQYRGLTVLEELL